MKMKNIHDIIRRTLIVLGIAVILLFASGCSKRMDDTLSLLDKQNAQTVKDELAAFESGDISEITKFVFDDELDSATSKTENGGIIADLFSNAQVQVKAVADTAITYTITSPDISDFFQANEDILVSVNTPEELGQAIIEYSEKAANKEYTVTLEYTITEDGIDIAYDNPEFINAMTGGLLDAYYDIFTQYLSEEN